MDIAINKSFDFSINIINLYKYLVEEKNEFVLSRQMVRAATSIGANIKEAKYGYSKNDFLYKINIALKEAVETEYWIQLLQKTNYIKDKDATKLLKECRELIKILVSTIKTTKRNLKETT